MLTIACLLTAKYLLTEERTKENCWMGKLMDMGRGRVNVEISYTWVTGETTNTTGMEFKLPLRVMHSKESGRMDNGLVTQLFTSKYRFYDS